MNLPAISILGFSVLMSFSVQAAEPLAQQYVVVHKVRDLDDPVKAVCVGTPDIIQLPSGRLIASMELWLKRPTSGDEGGIDYPNHCKIKASDDGGNTWQQISTNGITWGSLFYVNGALHMIGNDPHKRDVRIIRSPDGGESWSKPVTLFDDSRYHGSATPVHVRNGFVYRAFEDMDRGSASLVVAGDLSKDLLDPAAWRMSNKVEPPRETPSLSRKASAVKDGRDSGGNWFQAGCVAMSRNPLESFHYSSQVVVGDDLPVLSRSSIGADNEYRDYTWNSGIGEGKAKLPYNNHDSNMITLHRVKDFRSLALDLKPDFKASSSN